MTIRTMTVDDMQMVLHWAAGEGWNPGLDDAKAFLAADPSGFLIKEVAGEAVAAISVVNHDSDFAFLGLYLCKPAFRGQGHGMEIWRAGIAHAGARSIGLDGVPDQQANYARSGFAKYGSTTRYEGQIAPMADPRIRAASPGDMPTLIARDTTASGMKRAAFATAWFKNGPTRQTIVLAEGTGILGFATFRRCHLGSKIGPVYAASEADARTLLAANPFAQSGEPCMVDVYDHDAPLASLLKALNFEATFETARMFTGPQPASAPSRFQAIATMELG
ncbi:GNAT family N-acetyltransferase [Vannielia sp.]|uniref:GNAT family N-acetyltransferase n=1 Tax=Vannielia sp. TaxID=2813045 RepID=UPI0026364EBB|nr:GNAT family N-acetyltransferase [Vannielia sp.]MDF1871245.1 N-acetyltransferase [Vannielia sp.]